MISKAFSLKTLFAAGALATALAAAPAAEAGVSVGVGVGIYPPVTAGWNGGYDGTYDSGYGGGYQGGYGGGYQGGYGGDYQGGYGGGYQGGYDWHRPQPGYGGWVSCRDGRRMLWRSGYSAIEVQSCRAGYYRYTAWRNGKQYLMAVDARGDVSRLRRIY